MNKIIAIVGMCGAGKSVASEYLEKIGYKKVYFGGITYEKLAEFSSLNSRPHVLLLLSYQPLAILSC